MTAQQLSILMVCAFAVAAGCSSSTDAGVQRAATTTTVSGTTTTATTPEPSDPPETGSPARTEAFEFSSNGVTTRGQIHLPESFDKGMNLPTVYLIEFDSAGHEVAPEFETVIDSVKQINGLKALVATLEERPNITPSPSAYQEHVDLFRDMANHVDSTYTDNPSRTFIGRGFEAGIVLLDLFGEGPEDAGFDNYVATDVESGFATEVRGVLESEDFSDATTSKRLHFSFSASNNVRLMTELTDLIDQAEYPWLEFESVYYSDLGFFNAYPTAFTDGLAYVLGT
ncbi:MAG: hypothetical protein HKN94_10950 [Acidimicrobiales bacterium]|nr:hypothetical protein [Acidimicrobiia bacterium]NNC42076.1 hypothetical protein [Acidimicrobiia bacterium]NNC80656.1 hypothetical protein [Acidimicrobiales bacterium]